MKTGTYKNSFFKLPILDGLELLDARGYNQSFPFHTHPTFNISLILEQTFTNKLADRTCHAPVGAIVITNPGEVHATICDAKTGSTFFTFYISPGVLYDLNKKQPVFFDNKVIIDRDLFNKLLAITPHVNDAVAATEQQLVNTLKELIVKYAANGVTGKTSSNFFTQRMEEDIFEKFSLEKTAGKFKLDKYKFIRFFKQETGLTPNNYVIIRRIEKCKELLQTQDDLLDIAIQTGFYDATHLCKYFKKITGITPLAYHNAG